MANIDTILKSSRSSSMEALTSPQRWGFERVLLVFGEPQVPANQCVVRAEFLRDMETGEIFTFLRREGGRIFLGSEDGEVSVELG